MKYIAWIAGALLPFVAIAAQTGPGSDQPIEVNADALEVLQDQEKAIFTGNVLAIQGDMRLKSDVMIVHYVKKDGAQKSPADSGQSIEKIEVEGNVFLSTPEETASSARGLYDVANKKLYMNDNVVLTREKNVLKGAALVYDMNTGRSTLVGTTVAGQPAVEGQPPSRVRGVFMPKSEPKP